jgi:hypothetical protein
MDAFAGKQLAEPTDGQTGEGTITTGGCILTDGQTDDETDEKCEHARTGRWHGTPADAGMGLQQTLAWDSSKEHANCPSEPESSIKPQ